MSSSSRTFFLNRGVYVWNADSSRGTPWPTLAQTESLHSLLVAFCIEHNFNSVIIYNGAIEWDEATYAQKNINFQEGFRKLFKRLNDRGIKVGMAWYLNDEVNNLDNFEKAVLIVDAVDNFNKKYPESRIHSINGDQEPSNTAVYPQYLSMLQMMKNRRDELGADFEIDVSLKPLWLHQQFNGQDMFKNVYNHIDSGMIMAYSSNFENTKSMATKTVNYAESVNKNSTVAVETDPRSGLESASYGTLIAGGQHDTFLGYLDTLDTMFENKEGYHGTVVHAWSQYFKLLYGSEPVDFGGDL